MQKMISVVVGILLLIIKAASTDTYLNFTSKVDLQANVKTFITRIIGGQQYFFALYTNKTICRYNDQFKYLSRVSDPLANRDLVDLGFFTTVSNNSFYHGIVEGGS
jgi:hypothetical protein